MPIVVDTAVKRPGLRRVLLAGGVGGILGFESWRVAAFGFGASLTWHSFAWILCSQILLAVSVALSVAGPWWARGSVLGMIFSVPSVIAANSLGLQPAASAAAVTGWNCGAGLLIALLVDTILPARDAAPEPAERPGSSTVKRVKTDTGPARTVRQRLAKANSALERLDTERERLGDSRLGRVAEDRIIWNELIELELQDLDEQVGRIRAGADGSLRAPLESNPREGGPRESNQS